MALKAPAGTLVLLEFENLGRPFHNKVRPCASLAQVN